jgi:hypothetical protein
MASSIGDAQLVDRLRLHVEGGELVDLGAIVVAAVGQVRRRDGGAHARDVLGAHEVQQLEVRRLHHFADDRDRLLAQGRLPRRRHERHVAEGGVEETRFRGRRRDRGDRGVASLHGDARRGETAAHPGTHLVHLLVEVARDVAHLREPVLVVGQGTKRAARGVADVGPEGGVGVGRHLEIAEALVGDEHRELLPINVVVELLGYRQALARYRIHPLQHVLPVPQAHLLRRRIDLRQVVGNRAGAVLVVG